MFQSTLCLPPVIRSVGRSTLHWSWWIVVCVFLWLVTAAHAVGTVPHIFDVAAIGIGETDGDPWDRVAPAIPDVRGFLDEEVVLVEASDCASEECGFAGEVVDLTGPSGCRTEGNDICEGDEVGSFTILTQNVTSAKKHEDVIVDTSQNVVCIQETRLSARTGPGFRRRMRKRGL